MITIIYKRILFVGILAALLLVGCVDYEETDNSRKGYAPEGYFSFEPRFEASKAQVVISRTANNDELLDKIDNVFMFIFTATNEEAGIQDSDLLKYREYYQYGVMQNVFLEKNQTYYVYAVANLDESNIPEGEGNVHTFFDNVQTYGDLKNKFVQFRVLSPADLGKVIMTSDDPQTPNSGIVKIEYDGVNEIFAPKVELYRLQAKFVVNIYNKVNADRTNASGVTPTSINGANFPRKSYLVRRAYDYADGNGDGNIEEADFGDFYSSPPLLLPAPTGDLVQYTYDSNAGNTTSYYTKQTIEYFCFENRRGSRDLTGYEPKNSEGNPITEYEDGTLIGHVPLVYGRNELAPDCSSHLMLLSMTDNDVLRTFIHAGQGRKEERLDPYAEDDITNFDVDRNCVYHFNVIINSTKDVIIDSRREFLTQRVLFYLPEDARVDAHYVDMPSYIKSQKAGIAKLQAGTVPESSCIRDANGEVVDFVYENGVPIGWTPLPDGDTDENWLRFSWKNPYLPTRSSTGGINEPTTSKLYITTRRPEDTNVDGVSSATPILHFNEFVKKEYPNDLENQAEGDGVAAYPGTLPAKNPPSRTAAIRVGFVEGEGLTVSDYENATDDYPFFRPVTQYGLKTIGQLGGWNGELYTSMLGIESIEEHTVRHYAIADKNQDYNNLGGPWWYIGSTNTGLNHPYDGKQVTRERYNQYRSPYGGGKPPVRGETVSPISGVQNASNIYNPFSQTNAIDYCMRKNRDENGDGIISGDEVKWYLPSPAQAMQMYAWRDMFRGGQYTLNDGLGTNQVTYIPFGPLNAATGSVSSDYYWTTSEVDNSNALAVDFSSDIVTNVTNRSKTQRTAVRCVRDIAGVVGSMFYGSEIEIDGETYSYAVIDLENHFPAGFLDDMDHKRPTTDRKELQKSEYNTIAPVFLVSRWYVSNNNNTGPSHGNPVADGADTGNEACNGYSEPGLESGWVRPSQRELSFIYGNTGMIENMFEQQYATPSSTTYHQFITTVIGNQQPYHWAMSDIGNGSSYWWINFANGTASLAGHKNNKAYRRCIRYLTDEELAKMRAGAK
ncbi:hypothetical protein [Parabacteroides sp. PF5-9]|uniref:hypothetical protein n=1 Tax=Parabacteroides sp. PF5-9 TaxID=1742404 RepID=UPI0024734896|nr:hypothetical protein [Parabacteroides sp. PF5-9]MDH6357167.1 hypothetical protein [Parabacteroides sp. PF5-9]